MWTLSNGTLNTSACCATNSADFENAGWKDSTPRAFAGVGPAFTGAIGVSEQVATPTAIIRVASERAGIRISAGPVEPAAGQLGRERFSRFLGASSLRAD